MKPAILFIALLLRLQAIAQNTDTKAFLAANKATVTPGTDRQCPF